MRNCADKDGYELTAWVQWDTEITAIGLGVSSAGHRLAARHSPRGRGVLPHMGYIGMCGPKGYGFSAVLVINRVFLVINREFS